MNSILYDPFFFYVNYSITTLVTRPIFLLIENFLTEISKWNFYVIKCDTRYVYF